MAQNLFFPRAPVHLGTPLGVTNYFKINRRSVFKPGLIFSDNGIFQKPTWDLNSSTILSLTFETDFNSDAIRNCRPTSKWHSTVFLIWSYENVKSSMYSSRVLEYSPYVFYKSNPKSPCITNPDQLHMQSPQSIFTLLFSTSCHGKNAKLLIKYAE